MGENDDSKTPTQCALEIVEKEPRSTRRERLTRLLDAGEVAANEQPEAIGFAHAVMCQTGLPYRNPGDVR